MATGPSRIAAFALVGGAAVATERRDALGECVERSRGRIAEALAMTKRRIFGFLDDLGATLPPPVEDARAEAVEALERLAAHPLAQDGDLPDAAAARDAAVELFDVAAPAVETAVSDFLARLEVWAVERDKALQAEREALLLSAITDIQVISRKIHLISINASIEASRAGEAGRGFGVIANEIQSLSGSAREALERITSTIARNPG